MATSFSENQSAIIFQGTSPTLLKPATGVVDVSIYDLDNFTAKKVVSTSAIYVKLGPLLPLTEPLDARWTCAYLDGDTWSTDGVRLATAEELEAFNLSASGVWCVSYHLSIFAGFLDLLLGVFQKMKVLTCLGSGFLDHSTPLLNAEANRIHKFGPKNFASPCLVRFLGPLQIPS